MGRRWSWKRRAASDRARLWRMILRGPTRPDRAASPGGIPAPPVRGNASGCVSGLLALAVLVVAFVIFAATHRDPPPAEARAVVIPSSAAVLAPVADAGTARRAHTRPAARAARRAAAVAPDAGARHVCYRDDGSPVRLPLYISCEAVRARETPPAQDGGAP